MILNPEVFTEVFEECVVKLSTIIRNQHPGHSKPAYDIFLDEVLNILLSDIFQGFCIYPLREIINTTTKNFIYLVPSGKGPKMSSLHCAKGHGAIIEVRYSDGDRKSVV